MFKKGIPIIIVGLSVVAAMLVLGWAVFVEREAVVPVQAPVVNDEDEIAVPNDIISDDISDDVKDDVSKKDVPKILFSHLNGGSSIWIVDEDGSNLKQIVDKNIRNSYLTVLSPEKNKLAYVSIEKHEEIAPFGKRIKTSGIRIVDLATNESILIVSRDNNQASIGHPKFSLDGSSLVYSIEKTGEDFFYVTKLSDLTTSEITEAASIREASFILSDNRSSDGKKIVYTNDNDIYIADLNGNTKKIVFGDKPKKGKDSEGNEYDIFTVSGLSFSLDGKQVTYINNGDLFIVDVDGKNNKRLVDIEKDESKYIHVLELVPNSNKVLILESWPKGQDPYMQRLLLYDIDSKETKVIYEGDKYYDPKISPDGKFIAVSVSKDFRDKDKEGMYFMDLNGEILEKITPVSYYKILEWR